MKIQDLFLNGDIDWTKVLTYKEFQILKDTPQSQKWHKEGDVFEHTKLVVSNMKSYLEYKNVDCNSIYYQLMMAAALCHDLGKPSTTKFDKEKNDYTTHNHGLEGARITRKLFYDEDIILREKLIFMVRYHMNFHHVFDKEDSEKIKKDFAMLSYGNVTVKDMIILNNCDSKGSINDFEDEVFLNNKMERLINKAKELDCYEKPMFDSNFNHVPYFVDNINEETASGNFYVYIMIGIPGAGKDTYIKNHLPYHTVLCRDDIRTEIGIGGEKPMRDKKQEEEVTAIFNERMFELVEKSRSFIINNTNVRKKYRDDFKKSILSKNPNAKFVYIYVESPSLETNKERRKGQMSESVIDRMLNQLDFPYGYEYNLLIIDKQQ